MTVPREDNCIKPGPGARKATALPLTTGVTFYRQFGCQGRRLLGLGLEGGPFKGQFGNSRFVQLAQNLRLPSGHIAFSWQWPEAGCAPGDLPSLAAMPESLAACAAEQKQECSRFCISSPSVCRTRELGVRSGKRPRANMGQVKAEGVAQRQAFGEASRVDIHHPCLTRALTSAALPAEAKRNAWRQLNFSME